VDNKKYARVSRTLSGFLRAGDSRSTGLGGTERSSRLIQEEIEVPGDTRVLQYLERKSYKLHIRVFFEPLSRILDLSRLPGLTAATGSRQVKIDGKIL